jgi:NAD(P)H-hydrate epimerase
MQKINKPLVVDADALKAVNLPKINNCILTPHSKEFATLLKNNNLTKNSLRKELQNNIIILKGPTDEIISKNKSFYNKTGNAGMSVAGTGDVLAGVCAGILSQTKKPFESSCLAAYITGKAGDELAKRYGYGFVASDLLQEIPRLLKQNV